MPQLRDTEEGPPRTEGVVPLPREAGREGEGAQAPQGVQVLAFTFFSLAYLSAYSLTSGSTMDLSAWYQSETTFHLAPSHWAMRDQSVPRWLSQLVLTGRMILPKPDRKSTRLNSSHLVISYAVFCLKKKKGDNPIPASMASSALLDRGGFVCRRSPKGMKSERHLAPGPLHSTDAGHLSTRALWFVTN